MDHSTIHRWVVHFTPLILGRFDRRKRAVTGKWHADETYIKVRGQWMYLYRAIDSVGDTVDSDSANIGTLLQPSGSSQKLLNGMVVRSAL